MEDSKPGPIIMNIQNLKKNFVIPLKNSKSEYNVNIELNNNILSLSIREIEALTASYKKSYTLEDIKKISKVFSFHQDLSDIYEYLTGMLESKIMILNYEENSKNMYFSFYFEIPGTKKKEEIKLFLEKLVLNQDKNEFIEKELIILKNEINLLKKENINLKNKIENDDIKINLEEIINILIEEKLKEKETKENETKNKDKNSNIDENKNIKKENDLKSVNKLLNSLDQEHNEQFRMIKSQINDIYKKIYEMKNIDLINLANKLTDEIKSLKTNANKINNMIHEENQKLNQKINELYQNMNIYDNKIIEIKKNATDDIKTLQTIINEVNDTIQEKIQSFRLMVNDLNNITNPLGIENWQNQVKKENYISKFIRMFRNSSTEYQNKNIQLKLLYDADRDGRDFKSCHIKCDNIPNTFSIITTTKGIKFGFFRSISIKGNGKWLPDNKSFFYSFDKNKIYKIKNGKNAVKFDDNFFINTINFSLSGNILSDKYYCPNKESMVLNFEGFTEEYELNCGEKEFYIKKFKVYQLEIL